MLITLHSVRDKRTGKIHSVAVVDEKKARFFEPLLKSETEIPETNEEPTVEAEPSEQSDG